MMLVKGLSCKWHWINTHHHLAGTVRGKGQSAVFKSGILEVAMPLTNRATLHKLFNLYLSFLICEMGIIIVPTNFKVLLGEWNK